MKKFLIALPLALLASVNSKAISVGKVTVPRGKNPGLPTVLTAPQGCGDNAFVLTSFGNYETEEDDWIFTKVEGTSD